MSKPAEVGDIRESSVPREVSSGVDRVAGTDQGPAERAAEARRSDAAPQGVAALVEASMLHQARLQARAVWRAGSLLEAPLCGERARSPLPRSRRSGSPPTRPRSSRRPGESVLKTLGDARLWHALSSIGVRAHPCRPDQAAPAASRTEAIRRPIDGNFDRISFDTDPAFGTQEEFIAISRMAAAHNAVVIDDVIPSHTGKGPDFRLAEMRHSDYPGLYHMVEIAEDDWEHLPEVPEGRDAVNLTPATVDLLRDKDYIVGQLQRVIFFEPGVKETDWSATGPVRGVDGKVRRWVYLHYFKEGQPSLNWLDPSFAAQQMIVGDGLHSLDVLGARGLRLDANGFLGAERRLEGTAWSESHPLSITGNQILGGMARKAGGFTFQELNLTVDDIAAMSQGRRRSLLRLHHPAGLSPCAGHRRHRVPADDAAHGARLRDRPGVADPCPAEPRRADARAGALLDAARGRDVHLQGPDLAGTDAARPSFARRCTSGISGDRAPYNLRFVTNGVSCTTASLIAAALGFEDISELSRRGDGADPGGRISCSSCTTPSSRGSSRCRAGTSSARCRSTRRRSST